MDTAKEIILTPEGRQKLVDELAYREGEKAAEIRAALEEARGFGDLSENAEFDAAKEEQGRNEARIRELRYTLANAKVVESVDGEIADDLSTVTIGTTVELKNNRGKKLSFTIVGTTETNSLEHLISNESPAGAALIGAQVGDVVEFATPSGQTKKYTVTGISRSNR